MIEIIKEKETDYRFILKSESGCVLLNSVLLKNENEVSKMVKNLRAVEHKRNVFERKTNYKGEFVFNLKKINGELIGTSQLYGSEAGMENGIKNVKNRIQQLSNLGQL